MGIGNQLDLKQKYDQRRRRSGTRIRKLRTGRISHEEVVSDKFDKILGTTGTEEQSTATNPGTLSSRTRLRTRKPSGRTRKNIRKSRANTIDESNESGKKEDNKMMRTTSEEKSNFTAAQVIT